jgi:membrane protease YdiL (CAAX protease family)
MYSTLIYLPFLILDINLDAIPSSLLYTYYISLQVIFVASLIFIYRKDLTKDGKDFKENWKKYLKTGFNYWITGLIVMIISNIIIGSLSPVSLPENEQAIRDVLKVSPFFIIITSIIMAPIIEELIFRKAIREAVKNKILYITISGLIFGAFHILGAAQSLYSWLYIIPYAALGVSFAYTYIKTDNIYSSGRL